MVQLLWQEYHPCSICSVASKYPQRYSNYSSLSGTASYETYVASQEEFRCVDSILPIRPFYKARAPVRLTQERPKCALHHGKMSTNKCRARYEITHEHVSNDLKMWIKRLHTEIHNMITIYIHYKSIYFKIITCIILGLVNSNVFACKTNSAFNDFVDSCVTGKRNRTGAHAL